MRSLAKRLEISPALMSQYLSGKRIPSFQSSKKMTDHLPALGGEIFVYSVAKAHKDSGTLRLHPEFRRILKSTQEKLNIKLDDNSFQVISQWYHYAILMCFYKTSFKLSIRKLANQFNLNTDKIKNSLKRLTTVGLLEKVGSQYAATTHHIDTLDKSVTSTALKNRQRQILELSMESLEADPITSRNHQCMTMAIDPSKLPEAKKKIDRFMNELCDFLESGNRSEIYELQTSLFSLERGESK